MPTYVNHLVVLPNYLIWRLATQHIKNCIMIVVLILKMYRQIICVINRIIYGGNIISKKINFLFILTSYLRGFLFLLIFLSNNSDFICSNNKQLYFTKLSRFLVNLLSIAFSSCYQHCPTLKFSFFIFQKGPQWK